MSGLANPRTRTITIRGRSWGSIPGLRLQSEVARPTIAAVGLPSARRLTTRDYACDARHKSG